MEKIITTIPNQLGWQERERCSNLIEELFGKQNVQYTVFKYKEIRQFEKEYNKLDTEEEYLYVCEGTLKNLLSDLQVWHFNKNELVVTDLGALKLNLLRTSFSKDIIRQPKKMMIEGEFYQLVDDEFHSIPFENEPITSKRDIFLYPKINDRVKLNQKISEYFSNHLQPVKMHKTHINRLKYRPIIKEKNEDYVPKTISPKAFELAIKYDLSNLEFNFLNYFYVENKAMRNDVAQLFYEIQHNGIGWSGDRKWVKAQMKKIIDLGLVKFEIRYDCRDSRYTSWYFYDATKKLDKLKHDF